MENNKNNGTPKHIKSKNSIKTSNNSKKSPKKKENVCCEDLLKEYCTTVELRPGRDFNICFIPSTQHLNSFEFKCFNQDCPTIKSDEQSASCFDQLQPIDERLIRDTTVFLLHGVGGEIKVWLPQIIFLNRMGFNVAIMDFVGHGDSMAPTHKEAYHFKEFSQDVLQLFDRYKTLSNFIIGHSYGCSFSSLLAKKREKLVKGLVMISGGGPIPLGPELGVFSLPLFFLRIFEKTVKREFFRRAFHRASRNNPCYLTAVNAPTFVLKNTLMGQCWEEGDEAFYSRITCPTLLLHGKEDKLIPYEDVSLMQKTISNCVLKCFDGVGHMVMMETPYQCNHAIKEFLTNTFNKDNSQINK